MLLIIKCAVLENILYNKTSNGKYKKVIEIVASGNKDNAKLMNIILLYFAKSPINKADHYIPLSKVKLAIVILLLCWKKNLI